MDQDQARDQGPKPDAGAPDAGPAPDVKVSPHPVGYFNKKQHGMEAKLQQKDCRSCHGNNLKGKGKAWSCDTCHKPGWRTNCVFCHGGHLDKTGAPPRDLNWNKAPAKLTFAAHTKHMALTMMSPIGCEACHVKPANATSKGHMFDGTAGKAEVTFAGGLSAGGKYKQGTCSALYCHGNGQGKNGTATTKGKALGCASCHAYVTSSTTALGNMGGRHKAHLYQKKMVCADCHGSVDKSGKITKLSDHIDGKVATPKLYNPTKKTCTGLCHSRPHIASKW